MSYHTDFKKEKILDTIIVLMFRRFFWEISLKEISEATGIVSPVLYNYFGGISEINEKAYRKLNNQILELTEIRLPVSFPPHAVAVTIIFNIFKFFENSEISTAILSDMNSNPVDLEPLKNKFEELFSKMQGVKSPGFSTIILIHLISAHIEYARKINKPVPEETAEKIFRQALNSQG